MESVAVDMRLTNPVDGGQDRKAYSVSESWATGGTGEVSLQAPMVGREREFAQLAKRLDDAIQGRGSLVLISGEAGIGKTRLVQELKALAASKGVQVLSGNGLFESLTPYMPFREALRTGGLEHLFAENAPRVEAAYIVTHTGLLVKAAVREEARLDPDLFASNLLTVGRFVQESLSKLQGDEERGALTRLDYGGHSILLDRGPSANLIAVVDGRENEFLVRDMGEVILRIHESYGRALETWDGVPDRVRGIEKSMEPLLSRHDGVRYGEANPQGRRNLLFENVALGLARRAQDKPILLCIEDLQWADPSTVALLHYVARNTRTCGVCIVGTYRPEDLSSEGGTPHHLVGAMQQMEREDLFDAVELRRLPAPDTAKVLNGVLGGGIVPGEIVKLIQEDTEGNPLFIVELVNLMREEGWLRRDNGGWSASVDVREVEVPRRVQAVIQRRLGRLGDAERQILDVAATNGEEFTAAVVASALGHDLVTIQPALRALEQRHHLIRALGNRYRFDHVKIKEVLHDGLPSEFRARCHGLVASAMETQFEGRLDDVAGEIAFHYYRSGDRAKAIPYLRKAIETSRKQFANEEAIRFCAEALEIETDDEGKVEFLGTLGALLDQTGDLGGALAHYRRVLEVEKKEGKRAETLTRIGAVLAKQGEYEESINSIREGLSLAEGTASREEAQGLIELGEVCFQRGDYGPAANSIRRGLDISEKIGDQKGIAKALTILSSVQAMKGEYDQALDGYRRSLEIMETIGDLRGISNVLNNAANAHFWKGEYDQALDGYRRSLEIMERSGNLRGIALSLSNVANVHLERAEYDQALDGYHRCLQIMERIGDLGGIAMSLSAAANVHADRGEYDPALEAYRRSLKISTRIGNQRWIAKTLNDAATVHAERGDYDQAVDGYQKSLELRERMDDLRGVAETLRNLGWAHEERGNRNLALDCVERSLKIARDHEARSICMDAQLTLAEIQIRMGELDKAESLADPVLTESTELKIMATIIEAQRILGMIGRERKAWVESIRCFEQAVGTSRQVGRLLMEGQSRYEFGLMWKMKGDVARACEQLDSAAGIFRRLGLEHWSDKVHGAREGL